MQRLEQKQRIVQHQYVNGERQVENGLHTVVQPQEQVKLSLHVRML